MQRCFPPADIIRLSPSSDFWNPPNISIHPAKVKNPSNTIGSLRNHHPALPGPSSQLLLLHLWPLWPWTPGDSPPGDAGMIPTCSHHSRPQWRGRASGSCGCRNHLDPERAGHGERMVTAVTGTNPEKKNAGGFGQRTGFYIVIVSNVGSCARKLIPPFLKHGKSHVAFDSKPMMFHVAIWDGTKGKCGLHSS